MAAENKELSIEFYNYVCNIIGSEKVVKKRREIFTSMDCFTLDSELVFISSGSKAEGLDLNGSDFDFMVCPKKMRVYEDERKVFPFKGSEFSLFMDTNDTKPGFTLLRSDKATHFPPQLVDGQYISSKSHRDYYKEGFDNLKPYLNSDVEIVIHGPCLSLPDGSVDNVVCFRCQEWILSARQWISRPRNSWPDTTTIQQIVDYGVLFVPIGCKGSPNEDLEWRISFSVAEKKLIYTFNHAQLLCYSLLKIVLKDVIKKRYSDLLCSYFLKTIMFWVCEEYDKSSWKPENFIKCFMYCFRRLIYCVEYKICLHYFIPDYNLFEDRFNVSQHKGLLSYLRRLNNSGWSWILHTDTLQTYTRYHNLLPYVPVVSSFQNLDLVNLKLATPGSKTALMRNAVMCFRLCGNDMFIYHLSNISQHIAQTVLPYEQCNKGNKQRYNQYRRCRCYLMIGLNHDAVSGWLLLASLFYSYKLYSESIHIIEYCLTKCTTDKIVLSGRPDIVVQSRFERFMNTIGRGKFISTCKQCLLDFIEFKKSSSIIPDETRCITMVPSVGFAYLLKCLCLSHLGDHREKLEAYRDLQVIVLEIYFINRNKTEIGNAELCLQIASGMI